MKRFKSAFLFALLIMAAFGPLSDLALAYSQGGKAGTMGLVPGLGHFYIGQKYKGTALLALGATTIGLSVYYYGQAADAQDAYEAARSGADFDVLYDDMKDKERANHLAFAGACVVVCYSVFDAWWQGRDLDWARIRVAPQKMEVAYVFEF